MTGPADDDRAGRLRRALVEALVAEGAIRSAAWRAAFAAVPRHRLVAEPVFLSAEAGWQPVDSTDPRWLDLVYSDTTLVTQLDYGQPPARGTRPAVPTSSATAPGLMAVMLEALDVHDGHRVLEIGTGTGYNAALLTHRLADHLVTSIEVDQQLARAATKRLNAAGYAPTVITAEGAKGHPPGAPFDRIIATCSVPGIPPAWLTQTRPRAVIVTNVSPGLNSGALARLTVQPSRTAHGHLLPQYGSFMPDRTHTPTSRDHDLLTAALHHAPGTRRTTTLDPDTIHNDDLAPLIDLRTDATDLQWFTPSDTGQLQTWLLSPDGSWACLTHHDTDTWHAEQGGPHQLWDQIEATHQLWTELGNPARERLGLTAHPDGTHHLWLDHPRHTLPKN